MAKISKPKQQETSTDKFNRLVGNRTGRPLAQPRKSTYDPNYNWPLQIRQIARGSEYVKPATTKAFRTSAGSSGGGYSEEGLANSWNDTLNKIVADYAQNQVEQQGIDRAIEERGPETGVDRPWYEDIGQAVFGGGEEAQGTGGFRNSVLGRALDIISRPAYGLAGGLENLAGQETNTGYSPGDIGHSLGNFFSGVGAGLTGEEKTGFGQVYESYKDNPTTALGGPLRALEEAHPAIEQALAIAVGGAGELFLDPTNYFMGAIPTVARGIPGVATREVLQNLDVRNARTIAKEFATNSPLVNANPLFANDPTRLGDRVARAIEQNFDDSVVDVLGGGNRGTRRLNARTHPNQVANSIVTHITEAIVEPLKRSISILVRRAKNGNMTAATVQGMRNQYSDFDEFWKLLEADAVARKLVPPTYTVDDIIDAIMTGKIDTNTMQKIQDGIIRGYDAELSGYYNNALNDATNMTYRTIGIRLGNKVVPFKAPGRAYSWVGSKLNNHFPNLANRHFAGVFPGRLGLATGRAKALGFKGYDTFMRELDDFTRKNNFTTAEGVELAEALEKGIRIGDARKDSALDWLRDQYNHIYDEEVYSGARAAVKPGGASRKGVGNYRDPNYNYIYVKGGTRRARKEFIEARKGKMSDPNTVGAARHTIADARARGLNPVDDAFDNLRYRYLKSMRDRTRAEFLNDMVANYSIFNGKPVRKIAAGTLDRRGLVPVSYNKLNENLRAMVDADPNSMFYIPKTFDEAVKTFNDLSGWSSANGGIMMRNWGKVINILKAWQTLPSTGFHVRNAIGDILLGLMDDINPGAYKWVSQKFVLNSRGKRSVFDFIKGQPGALSHSYDEMWAIYERNADSGFINTEFGTYASATAGKIPRSISRGSNRVVNTVRNISDKRELIPRFTHFVEAYRQEAQALWNRGIRDIDVIAKRAEDAALYRVNSYKFDYAALLAGEKAVKSLAFPFYTYMRKAAPLLIQQMYANPHYLSLLSRTMQYNDESSAGEVHKRNFPQLIRDLGFAAITGGEEPTVLRTNFLPTDALSLASNIQGANPLRWPEQLAGRDLWSDILSDLNPMAQIPFELSSGRTIFGNREIKDLTDYFADKVPFIGEFQQEIADIPGLPGGSSNSLLDRLTGTPPPEGTNREPLLQSLVSNRLAGLGIPLETVSEEQQAYQQQENRDIYIEEPIKLFNQSQDLYSVSVSADMTYNVGYKDGQKITEGIPSLEVALDFARSLPGQGYQAPQIPGMFPPGPEDVNRVLGL